MSCLQPLVVTMRSILIGSVGIFSMLGFARIGFFGGGPPACIVVAWMAGRGWRAQGWGPDYTGVSKNNIRKHLLKYSISK